MQNRYEVHQIRTVFREWVNYCYIVIDNFTKTAFIVDPAWELNLINVQLSSLNVDLVAIFLTHSHYDHVNLVNPLIKMFNPTVFMSKKEIDYYKFSCTNLNSINDEDIISVGNTKIICLLTPGHTAGGMCYLLDDSIFTGDTIFIEGCGLCHGDGGSAIDMYESIQKVKSRILPSVRVYPGHSFGDSPGQTIHYLLKTNLYFNIDKKEHFVKFRMRGNQKILSFK